MVYSEVLHVGPASDAHVRHELEPGGFGEYDLASSGSVADDVGDGHTVAHDCALPTVSVHLMIKKYPT